MRILISKRSRKFVETLDSRHQQQIKAKLQELVVGKARDSTKKLHGEHRSYYRVEVGKYRIIYTLNEDVIEVVLIGKRNDDEIYLDFSRMPK